MITDHSRLLAREVLTRACEAHRLELISGDLDHIREVVLNARWPVRGRGGVARANAQTQREVRAAIAELYQSSELKESNT